MQLKLFNSLSRSLEDFTPIDADNVRVYCCGPTVYNYQHIGNLRTYIFEDVLIRVIRRAGFNVTHAMNITDVGHLVSDADEGEDKMVVAMKRERKTSAEIAAHYTDIFFEHCKWLNVKRPDVVCRATDHIQHMINLISRLEAQGFAYQSGGNVYFDVSKFPQYGKLAQLDLNALKAGARIEVDQMKRHPLDFALWFTNSKFENQELQWSSPWGRGYPGWHIECSAMAMEHLGEQIDIHCGGIDHIPVHHTNEIAQSEAASGKPFANYWLHGGFLVLDKGKMSKSTGEFLTLDVVKERGFSPLSYRLFCFSSHYRNELSWSWEALESAEKTLQRISKQLKHLRENTDAEKVESLMHGNEEYSQEATSTLEEFNRALFDDLNMPRALASLHSVLGHKSIAQEEQLALAHDFDHVLGLSFEELQEAKEANIPEDIIELADRRSAARKRRNWAEADQLRDEISARGFEIEDNANGYSVKKSSSTRQTPS